MLTLTKKLRRESEEAENNNNVVKSLKKVSVRDKLLVKEFQDVETSCLLPPTCALAFPDPDKLYEFNLTICPEEGHWSGGSFIFRVHVGEEYNFAPPKVSCLTKIWHPNINEEGAVCLSLLRESSIDELGWAPTRTIKDVIWGLNSLFTVGCLAAKACSSVVAQSLVDLQVNRSAYDAAAHFRRDLLNFDDPLNPSASEMYTRDREKFTLKVRDYMRRHCLNVK